MTTLVICLLTLLALAVVRALTWRAAYKAGYKQGVADAEALWSRKVASIISSYSNPDDFGFGVHKPSVKPEVPRVNTQPRMERPDSLLH